MSCGHSRMVHLARPDAQEKSNALNNEVALQRAWVSVARGSMAQMDMLEWFENILADYENLVATHAECSKTVRKYVTAHVDLEHNAKLYIDAINRLRAVKDEHVSHEYKKSLLEPFNIAIQAEWGNGLSDGRTDEEIMAILRTTKDFDPYSDKNLYPMYDKLFEKEYPYIEKIASGYRHSVADLLKVHPDPAPLKDTSNPNVSKAPGRSGPLPPTRT
ncbi:hypothetical protein Tco_0703462 [Tanacetum coccineum]|uniref:Uncharacterized protein n=1 Tax=Tanacetum coccineum TaxID=301880 RepID=A0ABQ4Y0F0_9ASTR